MVAWKVPEGFLRLSLNLGIIARSAVSYKYCNDGDVLLFKTAEDANFAIRPHAEALAFPTTGLPMQQLHRAARYHHGAATGEPYVASLKIASSKRGMKTIRT